MTIVGLIVLGAIKDDHLSAGNPYRLTNTIDYDGNICGIDHGVKNKGKGYYLPDLTGTRTAYCNCALTTQLHTRTQRKKGLNPVLFPIVVAAVCVSECPTEPDYENFFCRYDVQADADASIIDGYELVTEYKCMYKIKTVDYINRCLPDMDTAMALENAQNASGGSFTAAIMYNSADDNKEWFNNFLSDVLTLQGYIFGFGIGFSTGVAFLYLYFLRIPGLLFFFIWTAILSIQILLLVGSILLLTLSDTWAADGEHSYPEVVTMKIFAYFGFAVTALYFCLILVMRKRVQLAIGKYIIGNNFDILNIMLLSAIYCASEITVW